MTYFSNDVDIVLTQPGREMEVRLHRRSRKGFRDRLTAMEGRLNLSETLVIMPIGRLDEAQAVIAEEYPAWKVAVTDERPKQQRPGDRVWWVWETGGWGSRFYNGFVGQVRLFRIAHSRVQREGADAKYMECLFTELPGFGGDNHHGIAQCDSRADAEKAAEGILKRFVERLGAEFKED